MSTFQPIYKSKIGSHLSYPIKFSELNDLLSPAMEKLATGVYFTASNAPKKNKTLEMYNIIEVSYSPKQDILFDRPSWALYVSAIPRSLRAEVNLQLQSALPNIVRPWLLVEHNSGWYSNYHALNARYAAPTQELKCYEWKSINSSWRMTPLTSP